MDLANLTETFKLAKYKLESSYNSVGALAGVDIRSDIFIQVISGVNSSLQKH